MTTQVVAREPFSTRRATAGVNITAFADADEVRLFMTEEYDEPVFVPAPEPCSFELYPARFIPPEPAEECGKDSLPGTDRCRAHTEGADQ